MSAIKTVGLIFAALILAHWFSAGADEIVERPITSQHQ